MPTITQDSERSISLTFPLCEAVSNLTVCSGDGLEFKMMESDFSSSSEKLAEQLAHKKDGKLIFKDIKGTVMREWMKYLRTGMVDGSCESVIFDLALIAHQYDLPDLFKMLEPRLTAQVSKDIVRAMRVATLFDSTSLYRALGALQTIIYDLPREEKEISVEGKPLRINLTALKYRYPMFSIDRSRESLILSLQSQSFIVSQAFVQFLETSTVPQLGPHLFDLVRLAENFNLLDLYTHMESELIANTSRYDHKLVHELAWRRKSANLFSALADLCAIKSRALNN